MDEILSILQRIENKINSQTNNIDFNELKGTNRKCDSLGRITLPANVRKSLEIDEETEIKICYYNNCIVLIPIKWLLYM